MPDIDGAQKIEELLGDLKVDVYTLESESERRAAKVKNISLRLLGI